LLSIPASVIQRLFAIVALRLEKVKAIGNALETHFYLAID
jgi:hypothetical protein